MSKKFNNLIVEIEALHNEMTGNFVLYSDEALSDFESWVSPYKKPAILHHKDEDGKIVGRVLEAKKIPSAVKPGLSALWLKARITDKEMIEGIKDGTHLTTSVGAKGNHVECSICGHRIDSGYACQHKKGNQYKGKLCYWIVKRMTAKEISFVIVPSDKYSQIVKFYDDVDTYIEDPKKQGSQKGDDEMELQEALDKIKELEAANAEYVTKIQTAETALQESQEKLSEEILLREGLETKVQEIRLAEKQSNIQSIVELREKLGMRQIEKESLEAKSDVYLKEALSDLTEELNFKESEQQAESEPVLQDIVDLKESQKITNTEVPLEKSVTQIEKKSAKTIISNILG